MVARKYEYAGEIDIHDSLPSRPLELVEANVGFGRLNSRIVDQHIDTSPVGHRAFHHFLDVFVVRDIAGNARCGAAGLDDLAHRERRGEDVARREIGELDAPRREEGVGLDVEGYPPAPFVASIPKNSSDS